MDEQKKGFHYSSEDGIEYSIHQEHPLSSLGKLHDAKR